MHRPQRPAALAPLVLVAALAAPSAGQVTGAAPEALLRPVASAAGDFFGEDVAAAAGRVVVGAPGRAGGGAAFVFERVGGAWTQVAELVGADTAPGDDFGLAVATDGTRIVVGAPGHERNGVPVGAAYVFAHDGARWGQAAQLLPVGGVPSGARLGRDVDVDGERIAAVGSLMNGVDGLFVFAKSGGAWSHALSVSPTAEIPGGWSAINAVSLVGDWLASGAPFDFDPTFQSTGTACMHRLAPGGSTEVEQVFGDAGDLFGWSVALDDECLVVGNPFDQHPPLGATGAIWVYVRQGSVWTPAPTVLFSAGAAAEDQLGYAVAVQGPRIAASAIWADAGATNAGAVHVFEATSGGVWQERIAFGSPAPAAGQEFGRALALEDDRVFVGVWNEPGEEGESAAGAVHVVRLLDEPGWALCLGDGAGAACPCGNDAPAGSGTGCVHSGGVGIAVRGAGSRSVAADDLVLTLEGCPPGNSGLVFVGRTSLAPGVALYDGLQCAGGDVRRFGGRFQASGTVSDGGFVAQEPTGTYFAAGETYVFQYWTRDVAAGPSPCGTGATFSPGYAVTYAP